MVAKVYSAINRLVKRSGVLLLAPPTCGNYFSRVVELFLRNPCGIACATTENADWYQWHAGQCEIGAARCGPAQRKSPAELPGFSSLVRLSASLHAYVRY